MNKFEYKNLTPFKWFVIENFPFIEADFDALTEWQLFCKLGKEMNKIIDSQNTLGTQMENVTNAFIALQNYVDNYFDNLDVQEEVNNKLNEMTEDGTLDKILNNYLNINKIYNTTIDMKNDSNNLIAGMKIKTNGYSVFNDGGGAEFIISNIKNDDILQIKITDSLYANIILNNNEINFNALGGDYTGINDSSTLLNTLLNYINSQWLKNNYLINTIIFNGTYLLENQIILPPCARLRGTGYTIFNCNIQNNSAFHITYLSKNLPNNFPGNRQDWLYANLINFENGGLIKNIGTKDNSIGIEIGTNEDYGTNYAISRYKLCNFRIYNFDIALKHNTYNVYIGNYERISFEGNNTNVCYGDEEHTNVHNSGENMNYLQCLFAGATNGILWNCDGFTSYFTNCSFDFIDYILLINQGYTNVSIINSHIEGFKNIIKKVNNYSNVTINYCNIVDKNRNQYFNEMAPATNLNFENNKLLFAKTGIYNPEKICQVTNSFNYKNNYNAHGELSTFFINKNNKIFNFDNLDDGNIDISVDSNISNFKIVFKRDLISNTASIITDNYLYDGHKSLILQKSNSGSNQMSINIRTNKIPFYSNLINCNAFVKNIKVGCNILIRGYDINENQVFQSNSYHDNSPSPNNLTNEWWISEHGKSIFLPNYVHYFDVEFQFPNINNSQDDPIGTEYTIGGFIIN